MRYPSYIEEEIVFPEFHEVTVDYPDLALGDPASSLNTALDRVLPHSGIKRGDTVALAVGSRGIANLSLLVRETVSRLKEMGAVPAVVPAMGSHGGATAEGQKKVLEALGVTESSCGCPIVSDLAVRAVGTVLDDLPVHFSRDCLEMDHSICINRIKPHTKFKGSVESGIAKMLAIGMGKHQGALLFHRMALKHGFFRLLTALGQSIIENSNFRFGIGIVEDSRDRTMKIEAIPAEETFERERKLLETAKSVFPKLPVKDLDALIIGRIGKEISGSGMDPNVTGRAYDLMEDDFSGSLAATRVAILDISEKSGGNGIGLGNADFITEKLYEKLNYESTLMNALTSISLRKAFIPLRLPSDRKAIQAAMLTVGPVPLDELRVVIIRDTLHVTEFWASPPVAEEIGKLSNVNIHEKAPLRFDDAGNIRLFD